MYANEAIITPRLVVLTRSIAPSWRAVGILVLIVVLLLVIVRLLAEVWLVAVVLVEVLVEAPVRLIL